MNLRHGLLSTLAGPLLAVASERGLQHLRILAEIHDYRPALAKLWPATDPDVVLVEDPAHFRLLSTQLGEYFAGLRREFTLPLDLHGTAFQQDVWRRIAAISYGDLLTYRQLAEALDRPRAARAVGQAVGQNPVAILLPSHRVVGADGDLTGFLVGNDLKARLLRLEGHTLNGSRQVAPPRLF